MNTILDEVEKEPIEPEHLNQDSWAILEKIHAEIEDKLLVSKQLDAILDL